MSHRTHEPPSGEGHETDNLNTEDHRSNNIASTPTAPTAPARTQEEIVSESTHNRSRQSRRTRQSNAGRNRRDYAPTAPELPVYFQEAPPEYTSNLNLSSEN